MNIEITGTDTTNKGAELMLAAAVDRLRAAIPDAQLVVSPRSGSFRERARYGLLQKFEVKQSGRRGWLIDRLMHKGYRGTYGLVTDDEIDAVLDASGYSLGDAWRLEWIEAKAKAYERLRRAGKTIVLLPQAFGPFKNSGVGDASRRVLQSAHLVFPRDLESMRYVSEIVPVHNGVFQAPDFTNLLQGSPPSGLNLGNRPASIIPNTQMLRNGGSQRREMYVRLLSGCAQFLRSREVDPFILLHETKADIDLAHEVASEAGALPILMGSNFSAQELKGIIGDCVIVISSRFHGLVSALSQGVPALGTSWGHKYQFLFADYERPDWLLDMANTTEQVNARIDDILQNRERIRTQLLQRSAALKEQANEMWRRVEMRLLNGAATPAQYAQQNSGGN